MLKTNNIFFFDSSEFESIIQHYLDVGHQSLAHKAIKLGLEQHPASINLKLLRAESFIYTGELSKADLILKQLHAIEPNNEEIYIQKASILSKEKKHDKAIGSLKIALRLTEDVDQADVLAMIGMEYLYLDEFDNARLNFAKCLEVDHEDYSSLYNVVYCFDMESKHNEAVEYLTEFINNDPYCEVAWHQLGRQYFVLEKYEDALKAFDYAVVIDEFFVGAYLEKAKTLEKLHKYKEAIENYIETTELDDPTAFAYYRIGECYSKLKNNNLALQYFKKTVHEDPLLDKGWIALSNLYCDDKNYHKALYYINKALSIDGVSTLYWRMYAEINLKLNFFEEVVVAFNKCLEYNDENLEIFIGLSDVLNFIGDFEDAVETLRKGLILFPDHTEIEYRLACLYFILGNEREGIVFFIKAMKTDYEFHTVFREVFPAIFELEIVKNLISEFKV